MYILIIEDNRGIAELITERLSDEGYSTGVVTGGNDAIASFEKQWPDIFILDYSLPDMDGRTLISQLLKRYEILPPFIVSTGRGDEQVAVDMMKLGAYDYLIKGPLLLNKLSEVIRKLIGDIQLKKLLQEAEKALIESENRFRSFVENSSDLFIKLSHEGRYVYVSPNSKDLIGFDSSEIIGKSVHEFIMPHKLPEFDREFRQMVKEPNKTGIFRYTIWHKDGTIRYHVAKGISVFEKGKIFANCIVRDVTEKTLADNRILNAIIQTEESQRKLFAEDLHEGIGPNLSALKLYIGRVKNNSGLSGKDREAIERVDNLIDDSVNKIRQIANKLMPAVLEDFGLVKGLVWLVEQHNSAGNPRVMISQNIPPAKKIDKLTQIVIYRLIEDLIKNLQNNSRDNDKEAEIKIGQKDNTLLIDYQDFGCKFDPSGISDSLDLIKHQSRITSIQGFMDFFSPNGKEGMIVRIMVNCLEGMD